MTQSHGRKVQSPAVPHNSSNLINLTHVACLAAPDFNQIRVSHLLVIGTESSRHSLGSRIPTLVSSGSSRMKEAAGVSGLTEDPPSPDAMADWQVIRGGHSPTVG